MYFDTLEEYAIEIEAVRESIRRTMKSQRYGSSRGGVTVDNQRVSLPDLRKYLQELIAERDELREPGGGFGRVLVTAGRRLP